MAFNSAFHTGQLTDAQSRLVEISLHSSDPPTTANEVTTTAQRVTLSWSAPSGSPVSMTDNPQVSVNGGSTVAAVGFWDGASTPEFQGGGPVTTSETFNNDGTANVTVTVSES